MSRVGWATLSTLSLSLAAATGRRHSHFTYAFTWKRSTSIERKDRHTFISEIKRQKIIENQCNKLKPTCCPGGPVVTAKETHRPRWVKKKSENSSFSRQMRHFCRYCSIWTQRSWERTSCTVNWANGIWQSNSVRRDSGTHVVSFILTHY